MKDNILRTLITAVAVVILLILLLEFVFFPGLLRFYDFIDKRSCRGAFEAIGYVSETCARFIGR